MKRNTFFLVDLCLFLLIVPVMQSVVTEEKIVVDFYYSKSCGSCKVANATMHVVEAEFEKNYSGLIIFNMKEISNYTYNQERQARKLGYPSVIINNETQIPKENITRVYMENILNSYIEQLNIKQNEDSYTPIILVAAAVLVVGVLVGIAFMRQRKEKK